MNAYNLKLITYPNGSAQLKKYSQPILAKQYANNYDDFTFQEEELLRKGGSVWKNGKEYILSPFDNNVVCKLDNSHSKDNNEQSKETDIIHSLNRTRGKIHTYSRCATWEWFVTFTFSPEKVDRYDFDKCSRLVRRWLNNQRRNAPDLYYLIVPEQHKDGAWHFHGLLANTGKMKFVDSEKKDKGKPIFNMAKWANGFTTATAVTDIHKVSTYIAKYITKELCEVTKGKQRYFVSQNMPKPEENVFFIDTNSEDYSQFLSMLTDSLGYDVVHISTPRNANAFVDVDYIELRKGSDTTGRNEKTN